MHIICPHCTTSYAINLATLGAAGRTVRCSRCKEVWLARPEDATELAVAAPAKA
ncbi:MAG: zinc-ribbon domain-containing protein, partial [Bradyrhizobium sp.]|nr:zinc-ribbon domain-containing protein [Bradyrhizobium sp.]